MSSVLFVCLFFTFKNVATGKFQTISVTCIVFLLDSFEPEDLDFIQHSLSRVLDGCGLLPIKIQLVPCGGY